MQVILLRSAEKDRGLSGGVLVLPDGQRPAVRRVTLASSSIGVERPPGKRPRITGLDPGCVKTRLLLASWAICGGRVCVEWERVRRARFFRNVSAGSPRIIPSATSSRELDAARSAVAIGQLAIAPAKHKVPDSIGRADLSRAQCRGDVVDAAFARQAALSARTTPPSARRLRRAVPRDGLPRKSCARELGVHRRTSPLQTRLRSAVESVARYVAIDSGRRPQGAEAPPRPKGSAACSLERSRRMPIAGQAATDPERPVDVFASDEHRARLETRDASRLGADRRPARRRMADHRVDWLDVDRLRLAASAETFWHVHDGVSAVLRRAARNLRARSRRPASSARSSLRHRQTPAGIGPAGGRLSCRPMDVRTWAGPAAATRPASASRRDRASVDAGRRRRVIRSEHEHRLERSSSPT